MVIPFVRGLRKWLAGRQKASKMGDNRSHTASISGQGGRGSRQSHNKSRNRRSASRSESFSSDTNNQQPQDLGLTDNFIPKAWAHFRINRNEIINAIETTPGWTK